jgi:hypothetical protein
MQLYQILAYHCDEFFAKDNSYLGFSNNTVRLPSLCAVVDEVGGNLCQVIRGGREQLSRVACTIEAVRACPFDLESSGVDTLERDATGPSG